MIPEFKYVQEEAKFRLGIKREIKKMGVELDKNMRELPTESLLEIRDNLREKLNE